MSRKPPSNFGQNLPAAIAAVLVTVAICVIAQLLSGCGAASSSAVDAQGKTVQYDGVTYRQKTSMVSICVIGQDKGWAEPSEGLNGQADVIIDFALDTATGKLTGIVIPRDSMVEIDRNASGGEQFHDTARKQICLAYAYGADDESSSELVCTAVSRALYNIPVDYYFTTSIDGFTALSDAVGGVTVEALEDVQEAGIKKGETVELSGESALSYVRWRDEEKPGSAIDRQARQLQFVKALGARTLEMAKGDPSVLAKLFAITRECSTTNVDAAKFVELASAVVGGAGEIELISLEGKPVFNDESPWEQYVLDEDAVRQVVLDVYYERV